MNHVSVAALTDSCSPLARQLHAEHAARQIRFRAAAVHNEQPKISPPPIIILDPEDEKLKAISAAKVRRAYAEAAALMGAASAARSIPDMITDAVKREITISLIMDVVAAAHGITKIEIVSHRRTMSIVFPRQLSAYLARILTPRSLPEIGRRMGGRDHTTILYGARKIERLIKLDPSLCDRVEACRAAIIAEAERRAAERPGQAAVYVAAWVANCAAEAAVEAAEAR